MRSYFYDFETQKKTNIIRVTESYFLFPYGAGVHMMFYLPMLMLLLFVFVFICMYIYICWNNMLFLLSFYNFPMIERQTIWIEVPFISRKIGEMHNIEKELICMYVTNYKMKFTNFPSFGSFELLETHPIIFHLAHQFMIDD